MKHSEMLDPETFKYCAQCKGMVRLQYSMVDDNVHIRAIAICKRCGNAVGIVTKGHDMVDENALRKEIESMIYRRLARTEEWARENFDGDPKDLDDFIATARNEVLMAIGKNFRDYAGITPNENGNPLN